MPDSYTILMVEDKMASVSSLTKRLSFAGHKICLVADGESAIQALRAEIPDLVLLDLELPGKSGFDVLHWLRERDRRVPIIIITGKKGMEETVRGLNMGADYYLTKPVEGEELLAHINRIMERIQEYATKVPHNVLLYKNGDLSIDYTRRLAFMNARELKLTPTEFELLCFFAQYTGKLLGYELLLDEIWGNGYSDFQIVRSAVSRLRSEMEPEATSRDWKYIRTQKGYGYWLENHG